MISSFQSKSAGYLANHLARLFAQALAEAIEPFGLAPAQFMVLLELWREDGVTQRHLVDRLDVEQATMANTLKRMARDRLIERTPHPTDSRASLIALTDRARQLEGPAKAAARKINEQAFGKLLAREREQFLELLQRVIETLRETRDR